MEGSESKVKAELISKHGIYTLEKYKSFYNQWINKKASGQLAIMIRTAHPLGLVNGKGEMDVARYLHLNVSRS